MKSKKTKSVSIMLAGLLLLTALAGCAAPEDPSAAVTTPVTEAEPETITIIDGFGHEVTLTKPITAAIPGHYLATQFLKVLNVEDSIVAVDASTVEMPQVYGELAELPCITTGRDSYYAVDYEKIIELAPDVFITAVVHMEGYDAIKAALEPEIPCIALSFDSPEKISESINLLGELFDAQDAAQEYLDFYNGTLDTISERVSSLSEGEKTTLYYEWMQYYTFSKAYAEYQFQIDMAGGINVAADMETTSGTIDPEWLIEKDPEVIIIMGYPYEMWGMAKTSGYDIDDDAGIKALRDSVIGRPELSSVSAVVNERVYVIDMGLTTCSALGYAYMAKWLHPDLFEDFDPQAIHQEYLTRFLGLDYDLDEHGIFVYPEP